MKNKILMMRRIINKLIIPNLSVSQSFQTRTLENVKNKILMVYWCGISRKPSDT